MRGISLYRNVTGIDGDIGKISTFFLVKLQLRKSSC